jgi:L-ascorbate metabolism protein UlaG (beta-lactamase superfamily)
MLACLVGTPPVRHAAAKRGSVEITYVGNEGFLIEADGKKVLVDAVYREGVEGYVVPPKKRQEKMERAKAPFDKIDLVLATHFHSDHFDAAAVGEHLIHNERALFVSTPQAASRLRSYLGENKQALRRIRSSFPDERRRIRMNHQGIMLQLLNVHHGRGRKIENLGFIFELGGKRFLHLGDSDGNEADFRRNDLHTETLDFAFVPYWYLAYDDRVKTIRGAIHATHIIVMHLPPKGLKESYLTGLGGWEGMKKKVTSHFPNAVFFETEMEKRTFSTR